MKQVVDGSDNLAIVANSIHSVEGVARFDGDGTTWLLGKGPELDCRLKEAMQTLSGSAELERLRASREKMKIAAGQAKDIIALIRAGWHVSGRCQTCERMSL